MEETLEIILLKAMEVLLWILNRFGRHILKLSYLPKKLCQEFFKLVNKSGNLKKFKNEFLLKIPFLLFQSSFAI